MKLAIYQMDIIPGNPEENRQKVAKWINEVCETDKPDTLVLPEMWTTAYTLDDLHDLAEDESEITLTFIKELAKKWQVNLVGGSFATKENDKIFNRAVVIDRKGNLVYQYDKMHLVPMLNEHLYLEGGQSSAETFELDGQKMGIVICYDLRFPELMRGLALEGAQAVYIVAEWPEARSNHWKVLQQARAIENQMYIVSSNRVGEYDGVEFCGNSMIVNPWGDFIHFATQDQEETIVASLDLEKVKEVRENVPVFKSRTPDFYKSL
ncbi:carbon-nitrogen family hydrolase [Alkalihalophilus lindianensis]|uniref:Carbon-nitrogen family hydrolase n=1 Tax=Alkalihalophilus lindianensis TaxID=1630542 RepID=A0ABU3XDS1_9BACI|nr:carbon-nitrogen family hydrolase [Alkalihalophilus lindianensis]MDV2686036.1 carbon-nitrogen family hydrolase [Alkalihalophilus lindianensis]